MKGRARDRAPKPSVIVVNPGTHPEPRALAVGLCRQGYHVAYFTGSQFDGRSTTGRILRLISQSAYDSRVLPASFCEEIEVRTKGFALELIFQLLSRVKSRYSKRLMVTRSRYVSSRAASYVRALSTPPKYVVSQQTAGARVFMYSGESRRVLMQPIASQRWLEAELAKEANRNPTWSHSLQGLDRDREQLADMAIEMQLADVFIAGSHLVRRSLEADGLGPIIVQHYGVDDRIQRVPVTQRPEIDDSPIRLLFVGQVNQRKGISYLLEAMRQLEGIATLQIVGRGSDLMLRSILSLGLNNVSLTGPLSTERVLAEYQKSHLLVLPSLAEGFSLVVPEAMAAGLPCIVSEHAGSHEIVSHGRDGFVVPIADSAAIVSYVHEIRRKPDLLAQMSKAAARKGRTLTWDRFGEAAASELVSET